MRKVRNSIIQFYVLFVMMILPVLVHDSYRDIRDFKVKVFWIVFKIILPILAVLFIVELIKHIRNEGFKEVLIKIKEKITPLDLSVLAFFFIVLCSCLTSRYGKHAFTGDLTFKVGGYLLMAMCVMYVITTKCLKNDMKIHYFWAPIVIFLEATAILNSLDIDVLHMQLPGMTLSQKVYFISTIGHIDYLSEYFCLFIPFYATLLMKSEKKVDQILFSLITFLGYVISLLIRANGMILGNIVGFFILGLYCLRKKDAIMRYLQQYYLLAIAGLVTDVINRFYIIPAKELELDFASLFFTSHKLYIALAVIVLILTLLLKKVTNEDKLLNIFAKLKTVLLGLFIVGGVGMFCFAVFCVITNKQYAVFNNRINIWRGCMESFKHMSIREKLIGVGPNCVSDMLDHYAVYQGVSRTTAHNELLEYFISTGILGAISYASIFIFTLKALLKNGEFAYVAGLAGYIGISIVVGPSFLNTVTLWTYLALAMLSTKTLSVPQEMPSSEVRN